MAAARSPLSQTKRFLKQKTYAEDTLWGSANRIINQAPICPLYIH